MSTVYPTGSARITYLSPTEYSFLLHRTPELGFALKREEVEDDHRSFFEKRIEPTARLLYRWLRWRFDDIDPATLDDCMQAGLVGLWKAYLKEPEKLEAELQCQWNCRAKFHAHKAMYRKYAWTSRCKRREGHRWYTVCNTFTDLQEDDDKPQVLELIGTPCEDLDAVEERVDLERAIAYAVEQLKPEDRADALTILNVRMEGYVSREEVVERTGMLYGRIGRIERLLKKHLCDKAGKVYAPRGSHTRNIATDEERALIFKLRGEGMSFANIAARTGRSAAYVCRMVNGKSEPSSQEIARYRALREQGMTLVQICQEVGKSTSHVSHVLRWDGGGK
jgi:uncharacterized protein YerC